VVTVVLVVKDKSKKVMDEDGVYDTMNGVCNDSIFCERFLKIVAIFNKKCRIVSGSEGQNWQGPVGYFFILCKYLFRCRVVAHVHSVCYVYKYQCHWAAKDHVAIMHVTQGSITNG